MLLPLLADDSLDYNVAWALGEIGGDAAVNALIGALAGRSPDLRASAILALQKRHVHKALPAIRALLTDSERTHGGALLTVGETARAAVAALTAP
jgi:HEAT repeat protein